MYLIKPESGDLSRIHMRYLRDRDLLGILSGAVPQKILHFHRPSAWHEKSQNSSVVGREESRMDESLDGGVKVCLQSHRMMKEETVMVSPVVISCDLVLKGSLQEFKVLNRL